MRHFYRCSHSVIKKRIVRWNWVNSSYFASSFHPWNSGEGSAVLGQSFPSSHPKTGEGTVVTVCISLEAQSVVRQMARWRKKVTSAQPCNWMFIGCHKYGLAVLIDFNVAGITVQSPYSTATSQNTGSAIPSYISLTFWTVYCIVSIIVWLSSILP